MMNSPIKVLILGICLLISGAIAWKFRSMLIEAEPVALEAHKDKASALEGGGRQEQRPGTTEKR